MLHNTNLGCDPKTSRNLRFVYNFRIPEMKKAWQTHQSCVVNCSYTHAKVQGMRFTTSFYFHGFFSRELCFQWFLVWAQYFLRFFQNVHFLVVYHLIKTIDSTYIPIDIYTYIYIIFHQLQVVSECHKCMGLLNTSDDIFDGSIPRKSIIIP